METKNKKNQKQADGYKDEILKKSGIGTTSGYQTLLRPEYYQRMEELIRLFAKEGVTVEDYLDNVLTRHFAQLQKGNEPSCGRHAQEPPYRNPAAPATKFTINVIGNRVDTGNVQSAIGLDGKELLATFLESSEIKTRQCVYIDRETHRQIAHITKFLGEGLSIGKFVDNILRDHIRRHKALYKQALGNINPAEL
jgi:cytochrome c biogenesis protein ResB